MGIETPVAVQTHPHRGSAMGSPSTGPHFSALHRSRGRLRYVADVTYSILMYSAATDGRFRETMVSHPGRVVHYRSPPEAKISLFRSLFRGREDVYPRRFESRMSGRSGYAPACTTSGRQASVRSPASSALPAGSVSCCL